MLPGIQCKSDQCRGFDAVAVFMLLLGGSLGEGGGGGDGTLSDLQCS